MYVGGTYARLVYSWYQNIFHVISVMIVFHAANGKKRMKTILKQDRNSRQRQDIVPVSNLKERKIKNLLSLPIHLAHHRFAAAGVALLSLRSLVAPLCCCSVLALMLLHSVVAPLSLCNSSDVARLSLYCVWLSLGCRSAVAWLSLGCCSAVARLSLH